MMRIKLLIFCFVLFQSARSQTGLIIQGASPDLHLVHTVVAKENWYSIGRIYNLSPKDLAPYNKTTLDKPLNIGQLIRIPLTATNFSQNGTKLPDESFIPLYYIVQEKEGMYRVSITHNKVSADNIKKWNSLSSEQLKNGMKLVVGYLKVKGDQSPFASGGSNKINAGNPSTVAVKEPAKDPVQQSDNKQADSLLSTSSKETVKEENSSVPVSGDARPEVINPAAAPANYKGGFFKKQYAESGKSTTGNAGTFKSTSGWNDGKYYALMNNVPIGTIVKVSFSSTNKSIFAKVLGQLPEMKESAGLAVRLSDAAASELGVANSKFYVDVKY